MSWHKAQPILVGGDGARKGPAGEDLILIGRVANGEGILELHSKTSREI